MIELAFSGVSFSLQGEYDSPGDDMNDRKVSLYCPELRTLGA